jgi:hypothetical protein
MTVDVSQALQDFFGPVLGAGDWEFQVGRWYDAGNDKRYAVMRAAGGVGAELVRRPQFTLLLIGLARGDNDETSAAAGRCIEASRDSAGDLVFVECGEPVFLATQDGRPMFEIAVSVISN